MYLKKDLKIPKGYSDAINRRTDNTLAKRKRTINNLQNTTYKTGLNSGAPERLPIPY